MIIFEALYILKKDSSEKSVSRGITDNTFISPFVEKKNALYYRIIYVDDISNFY